jgi:hypothetical protein
LTSPFLNAVFPAHEEIPLLPLAIGTLSSCTYQEKYPGGDSSHSTIRLLPSE